GFPLQPSGHRSGLTNRSFSGSRVWSRQRAESRRRGRGAGEEWGRSPCAPGRDRLESADRDGLSLRRPQLRPFAGWRTWAWTFLRPATARLDDQPREPRTTRLSFGVRGNHMAASKHGRATSRTLLRLGGIATLLALASAAPAAASEAELILPDLGSVSFLRLTGRALLMGGLGICVLGVLFGLMMYSQLKNLPVHRSMREISELIFETCKTYLVTQGKFILLLEVFIGAVMIFYFGWLRHFPPLKVAVILGFSLVGIAGSYMVAWFGIRVNTFANSRSAFASLRGKPFPTYAIPLKAGMSIGMLLISTELVLMLLILLFVPSDYAGPCFIGFAIGESLGAAALRIAG